VERAGVLPTWQDGAGSAPDGGGNGRAAGGQRRDARLLDVSAFPPLPRTAQSDSDGGGFDESWIVHS